MQTASKPSKSSAADPSSALPVLTKDQKIENYRKMLLIRRFEEKSAQAFSQQKIVGFCHLYIGQEALAVGTIAALNPDDAIITGYRDHGHAIARDCDINGLMAELFGKKTGCSKGKGGSMHFFDREKHFFGGHGIVGGQTPLGAGIAFAQKYNNTGRVTMCFLGDGAINQGAFHEALNLAALWKLPIVYVIENNAYAMGTSIARSSAGYPLTKRASGYDMAAITANGMDIDDVRAKTWEAVNLARTESQPTLMDIETYRYKGHSMSDPGKYRTAEEVEKFKQTDPIDLYRSRLLNEKVLENSDFDKIDEELTDLVQKAYDFADASEKPGLEEVYDDIFSPETEIDEIKRR